MAHEARDTLDESGIARPLQVDVTLRLASLLAVPLAAAAAVSGARAGHRPGVRLDTGVVRMGSGNWSSLSNVGRYGMIVVGAGNATAAGAQPGRSVMYACGTNTSTDDRTSSACGVSWTTAVANNWVLRDSSGNPIYYRGNTGIALLDIGNSSYQHAFISAIDADLRRHRGVDGVFIDDVTGSLITGTNPSVQYPDNASYRAAMLSFISTVGPALQAKGWYVDVNASIYDPNLDSTVGQSWDGTQYIWWVNQIASYVNGINMEHWQQNWDSTNSIRVTGSTSASQAWDQWERVPSAVYRLHKDFYAMEGGALSDLEKATYLRASFLLVWEPTRGAFLYTDDYAGKGDPWRVSATPHIGIPAGVEARVGDGYVRAFTRGIVIVNPGGSLAQSFRLGRAYVTSDGSVTTSITLPPGTAQILRRAPERRASKH